MAVVGLIGFASTVVLGAGGAGERDLRSASVYPRCSDTHSAGASAELSRNCLSQRRLQPSIIVRLPGRSTRSWTNAAIQSVQARMPAYCHQIGTAENADRWEPCH